jgi:protocadherin delta 1
MSREKPNFSVVAREAGLESEVGVEITVVGKCRCCNQLSSPDTNDNAPIFSQPIYATNTREDIELGKAILSVSAVDKDSGSNAELVYSLDDLNFSINSRGEISARRRLDADQLRERAFIYRFNVTATDRGRPRLSGRAIVCLKQHESEFVFSGANSSREHQR